MLHAGLDLSRGRVDVCLVDDAAPRSSKVARATATDGLRRSVDASLIDAVMTVAKRSLPRAAPHEVRFRTASALAAIHGPGDPPGSKSPGWRRRSARSDLATSKTSSRGAHSGASGRSCAQA